MSDIGSVVSMMDRIAGSAPGNGSRATVGEDLVSMTKCRLLARNFLTQDGSSGTKRMRRHASSLPLNVAATVGSMNDSSMLLTGTEIPELDSTATSSRKKAKTEVLCANYSLILSQIVPYAEPRGVTAHLCISICELFTSKIFILSY